MGVVAALGKAIVPGYELVNAMAAVRTNPLKSARPTPSGMNCSRSPEKIEAPYEIVWLMATIPANVPAKIVKINCWGNLRSLPRTDSDMFCLFNLSTYWIYQGNRSKDKYEDYQA